MGEVPLYTLNPKPCTPNPAGPGASHGGGLQARAAQGRRWVDQTPNFKPHLLVPDLESLVPEPQALTAPVGEVHRDGAGRAGARGLHLLGPPWDHMHIYCRVLGAGVI